MERLLTADEVFAIGLDIEKNGYAFYTAAAAGAAGHTIKILLTELAAWESKHIEIFRNLRKMLPPETKEANLFDPADELSLYLKATADNHVFILNSDMDKLVAACNAPAEILSLAMSFEKDSVVFYSSVREAVDRQESKAQIELLIHQELSHIGYITREMQKIKAASSA